MDWLLPIGLACSLMLEYVWHLERYNPEFALVPLLWYLTFYAVFALFPFLFCGTFASRVLPWVVAALSGPLHFGFDLSAWRPRLSKSFMGLLPAAFALPSLLGLFWLVAISSRRGGATSSWPGGVAPPCFSSP